MKRLFPASAALAIAVAACGESATPESDTASELTTGAAETGRAPTASPASSPTATVAPTEAPSPTEDGPGPVASIPPTNPSPTTTTMPPVATSTPSAEAGSGGVTSEPTGAAGSQPTSDGGLANAGGATGSAAGSGAVPGTGGAPPVGITGSTPVERHGQLEVDGNRLVGKHGEPVTLRGQGFGWDNWWPQYYNADVVGWLQDDWCVDLVRPAMGIEPDGAYLQNPDASRNRVYAVVDAAIARELYVIVDWHAHDIHLNEAVAFFSQLAEQYGDQPNVIYEVYNEPDDETWPEVKAYAETVIAAIREHDPDNLVIVGSPEWDQRVDLVAADPITSDDNVIYAVHFYASTHDGWLRDRAAEALAAGIPLFVSESSGSEAAGTGANDYAEWEAWFQFMDENQVSWINYSVSDKAGETISVLEPGAPANGAWDASQLTETGEYIRDVFKSYCQ